MNELNTVSSVKSARAFARGRKDSLFLILSPLPSFSLSLWLDVSKPQHSRLQPPVSFRQILSYLHVLLLYSGVTPLRLSMHAQFFQQSAMNTQQAIVWSAVLRVCCTIALILSAYPLPVSTVTAESDMSQIRPECHH